MILISSLPEHVWKTLHVIARDTGLVPDEPWQEWPTHEPWVTPRGNQVIPDTLLGRSVAKIALAVLTGIVKLEDVKNLREIPILHRLPPMGPNPPVGVWMIFIRFLHNKPRRVHYFGSPHDTSEMTANPADSTRAVGVCDAFTETDVLTAIYRDREALMSLRGSTSAA